MDKLPKVIVAALIEKDNRYLLIKELLDNGKEQWILPGGTVEFGESMMDAVKREIKEETNLDIDVKKFIEFKEAIYPKAGYHTIIFFFHATPVNGNLKLESKALAGKFFSKDEIKKLNLVESADWLFEKYGIL